MPALRRRLDLFPFVAGAALLAALAVRVAYDTQPLVPLVAVGALAGLALAFWRPTYALCASVALVPLELFSVPLGGFALSPSETMFVVTGSAWALKTLAQGRTPWTASPLGLPLALLVVSLLPGLFVAVETVPILKIIVMWTSFVLLYQMIVTEGDAGTVRLLLLSLAVAGAVVGVIALARSGGEEQQLIGFGDIASGRAKGSFQQPNTLASFVALALPGALALGVRGPVAWRPFALACGGIAFAGLALSLSRGGLIAAAVAVAVMLLWRPVRRWAIAAGAVVAVLILTAPSPLGDVQQIDTLRQRVSTVSYSSQVKTNPRVDIWRTAVRMANEYPLSGIGAANFEVVSPRYGLVDRSTGRPADHAHQIPLTFATELGLLGLGALAWLVIALARTLWRALRRASGVDRGLAFAVTAALLGFAVQGLVDYTLRTNVIAAVVISLMACAVVLSRTASAGR